MKYAEAVFTPSFHGNVFAILNHRNLFALILDDGHDTRARELLTSLGIEGRFLRASDEITESPIDWNIVDIRLKDKRDKSMEFVKRALNMTN